MAAEDKAQGGRNKRRAGSTIEHTEGKGSAFASSLPETIDGTCLAPEFGAKLDESGEPLPVKINELALDPGLKQLALKLWRDFQTGRVSVEKSLQGAGLDKEDLWKPGITEALTTSSTKEEIARYRQKLQFRADFLEAALEETLLQLEGLEQYGGEANDIREGAEVGAEQRRSDNGRQADA